MSNNTTIEDQQEDQCLTEFCRSVMHECAQLQLETAALRRQLQAKQGAIKILTARNKALLNGNPQIQAK